MVLSIIRYSLLRSAVSASNSRGDKGDAVTALQVHLRDAGLYAARLDGDFGAATEAAVQAVHKSRGLTVDGWTGIKTVAALSAALHTAPVFVVTPPAQVVVAELVKATAPVDKLLAPVPVAAFTKDQLLELAEASIAEVRRLEKAA